MFTLTFLGKNPLTRQTRRTFNRPRANSNGPIRNTIFFAETNQRQSCSMVPQSSWSLSSTCTGELWVEIVRQREMTQQSWRLEVLNVFFFLEFIVKEIRRVVIDSLMLTLTLTYNGLRWLTRLSFGSWHARVNLYLLIALLWVQHRLLALLAHNALLNASA